MSDDDKSKSWWYTLPGVITSITAAVTALAGLIIAIKQTGWLEQQTPAITTRSTSTPTTLPSAAPLVPVQDSHPVTSPTSPARPTYAVELPALRDYRLGSATFTLLKAEVSPRTTETDGLQIRLRLMNHGRYDVAFSVRWFRLIVDGVPTAPEGELYDIVPAESAKEDDLIFVVPHGTTGAILKISYVDDSTEIPLALGSPR